MTPYLSVESGDESKTESILPEGQNNFRISR